MDTPAQVALFGSIGGGWREAHIIPLLEQWGVTYYNPVVHEWTQLSGQREADAMAQAETVLMVFNDTAPAFTGLAEAGWAALGASQRGQTFILYVMSAPFKEVPPWYVRWIPYVRRINGYYNHYAYSLRVLVKEHAARFNHDNLHVVDSMDAVIAVLREKYG